MFFVCEGGKKEHNVFVSPAAQLIFILSCSYVKVYLLPDKSKSGKRKTKVKKHTLNPVFDEILKVRNTAYLFMSVLDKQNLTKKHNYLSLAKCHWWKVDCHVVFTQFQMPLSEVERRTLWLTVWHSDMFGRNDFLGEVMLPMHGQAFDDPTPRWHALQDRVSDAVGWVCSSAQGSRAGGRVEVGRPHSWSGYVGDGSELDRTKVCLD